MEDLSERELLVEALKWLRGGGDRLACRFSTNYALIRAIASAVGDVREDEA